MKILGVDFSLNGTGLAVLEECSLIDKYVFSLKKSDLKEVITIPKFEEQSDKLDWVCKKILDVAKTSDFICMEEHTGSYYSWMDGYAILKHLFRENGIPYITISPTSLKKFVVSGKADKNQMAYYLRQEFNLDFDFLGESADNIVDATWLAFVGECYSKRYNENARIVLTKDRSATLEKIQKGKHNKWHPQYK